MSDDARIFEPDHLPTPYTAEEIRLGCPMGRAIRLQVDNVDESSYLHDIVFVECDETGAFQEIFDSTLQGESLGSSRRVWSTWRELQSHASFPAEHTVVVDETVDTPLGTLQCFLYTVDDGTTRNTFWFARDLPGMPVRFTKHQDGQLVSTTTMLSNSVPS